VFLVVEGYTDKLVYGNFVNPKTCEFVISDGKEQALNTIKILDNDKFTGVLAVVDADFDRLENNLRPASRAARSWATTASMQRSGKARRWSMTHGWPPRP
jgi:hypothetical protein